jgi:beta-phosphoglucomutase
MEQAASAFLFDLNGTMIDDMLYHLNTWHQILNEELGATLSLEEVKAEMYGKNSELLERVFGKTHFSKSQMDKISMEKELRYQEAFRPDLALIRGLPTFLEQARIHHIQMAIGSAAIPFNIDFVLDGLQIRHYFKAVVSADDVMYSKPDPQTYLKAAAMLKKRPSTCVVFEDAPKGVESALRAGMRCVAITTLHAKEEFARFPNILHVIKDYADPYLYALFF